MYVLEYYTYHLRAYGYRPRYRPSVGQKGLSFSPRSQPTVHTGPKWVQGSTDGRNHTTPSSVAEGNQTRTEKMRWIQSRPRPGWCREGSHGSVQDVAGVHNPLMTRGHWEIPVCGVNVWFSGSFRWLKVKHLVSLGYDFISIYSEPLRAQSRTTPSATKQPKCEKFFTFYFIIFQFRGVKITSLNSLFNSHALIVN